MKCLLFSKPFSNYVFVSCFKLSKHNKELAALLKIERGPEANEEPQIDGALEYYARRTAQIEVKRDFCRFKFHFQNISRNNFKKNFHFSTRLILLIFFTNFVGTPIDFFPVYIKSFFQPFCCQPLNFALFLPLLKFSVVFISGTKTPRKFVDKSSLNKRSCIAITAI